MNKKSFLITIFIVFLAAALFAQEGDAGNSGSDGGKKKFSWPSFMRTENADVTTGFRRANRLFELSFLNTSFGLSNSWFGIGEMTSIFGGILGGAGTTHSINDLIEKGELAIENSIFSQPLAVRVSIARLFTLDINVSYENTLMAKMSDTTLSSLKTMTDLGQDTSGWTTLTSTPLSGSFDVSGSAYGAFNLAGEITLLKKKLWLRAGPSIFVPMLYTPKGNINFSSHYDSDWYTLSGDGEVNSWLFDPENIAVGADISVEGRYALWPILDLGLSVLNIPFVPATMKTKQSLSLDMSYRIPNPDTVSEETLGQVELDDVAVDFSDKIAHSKKVMRPTRFNFYAIVKPFRSKFIIVRPDLGFSVNTTQADALFNWGLSAQLNLPKILSVQLGTKLFEEVWTNYAGLVADFRFFEIELSGGLRGPSFVSSWTAKGFNAYFGIKSGF